MPLEVELLVVLAFGAALGPVPGAQPRAGQPSGRPLPMDEDGPPAFPAVPPKAGAMALIGALPVPVALKLLLGPAIRLLEPGEAVGDVAVAVVRGTEVADDVAMPHGGVVVSPVDARRHTARVPVATAAGPEVETVAHGVATPTPMLERTLDGRTVVAVPIATAPVVAKRQEGVDVPKGRRGLDVDETVLEATPRVVVATVAAIPVVLATEAAAGPTAPSVAQATPAH